MFTTAYHATAYYATPYYAVGRALAPIITRPVTALDVGGYTQEMDQEDVLDLCSIIIMSGVLDE